MAGQAGHSGGCSCRTARPAGPSRSRHRPRSGAQAPRRRSRTAARCHRPRDRHRGPVGSAGGIRPGSPALTVWQAGPPNHSRRLPVDRFARRAGRHHDGPAPVRAHPAHRCSHPFLLVRIESGGESTTRSLLSRLGGLVRSVGFRVPAGALSCVAAIGSEAWDRLFSGPRPAELHPFAAVVGGKHRAVSTPGDLLFPHPSRAAGPVLRAGGPDHERAGRTPAPSWTRCTASSTSRCATCWVSSMGQRIPAVATLGPPCSSARKTRRSPGGSYVIVQKLPARPARVELPERRGAGSRL